MRRRFKLIRYIVLLAIMLLSVGPVVLILGRMDETVRAFGIVEPAHYKEVKPKVDGIIEKILVREGDGVKKGDTLATLHADELRFQVKKSKQVLAQAKADLSQLKEEYQNLILSESFETTSAFANLFQAQRSAEIAKEKYERAQELYEKNLISSEDRDDIRLNYELSQSQYRALKERAELLERRYLLQIREKEKEVELAEGECELAMERLKRSVITAPISGEILTQRVEELVGTKVIEGEAILEIGDLTEMNFIAEVDEADIPNVRLGQEARIFINAFPHRRYKVFQGKVLTISPKPELTNRGIVFEVKLKIANPWVKVSSSLLPLKPGLSGKAMIIIRHNVRLIQRVFGVE